MTFDYLSDSYRYAINCSFLIGLSTLISFYIQCYHKHVHHTVQNRSLKFCSHGDWVHLARFYSVTFYRRNYSNFLRVWNDSSKNVKCQKGIRKCLQNLGSEFLRSMPHEHALNDITYIIYRRKLISYESYGKLDFENVVQCILIQTLEDHNDCLIWNSNLEIELSWILSPYLCITKVV